MYRYVRFFKDSTGSNRSIQACWIFLWVHFRVNGINRSHGEYSGEVEHPDRLILNTLTGEIEQAFRRN